MHSLYCGKLLIRGDKNRLRKEGIKMLSIEKGGEEFKFWADLFQFRKKFYEPPVDNKEAEEKFWEELIKNSDEICTKYMNADFNKHGLVKKQIIDIVEDLEAKFKEARTPIAA
jgi:hypothetical protein